jgi:hypothetical protein
MRLLIVPVVAVIVLAGVWVSGGLISEDFRTSMGLTAIWFAISGAACLLVARRWRPLRVPVVMAVVLTAGATGAYLGLTTLRDRVVHERVITATAAPHAGSAQTSRGPLELAEGSFRSHEHETVGKARIVRGADGRRFLTLTSFSTSPGPDLRVRLVPGDSAAGGAAGSVDLGPAEHRRTDDDAGDDLDHHRRQLESREEAKGERRGERDRHDQEQVAERGGHGRQSNQSLIRYGVDVADQPGLV